MGMVRDNYSEQSLPLTCGQTIGGIPGYWIEGEPRSYPTLLKDQYGFRSSADGNTELVVRQGEIRSRHGHQANDLELIKQIEHNTLADSPYQRSTAWGVNDRDYTVFTASPSSCEWLSRDGNAGGKLNKHRSRLGFTGFNPWALEFPISTAGCEAWAGSSIRAVSPMNPSFNLTRFVGELRDAPRMLQFGNYVPLKRQEVGGSYLNYQYGLAPTLSDIQNAAQAVIDSKRLVNEFVREATRQSRRRTQETVDFSSTDVNIPVNGSYGFGSTLGSCSYVGLSGATWYYNVGPKYVGTVRTTHILKAFSTFEWFVGDPDRFLSRNEYYQNLAKQTLGGGLDVSTAYQLTPWTWLVDWFYDLGSLVSYQQKVADYALVQRRSGYVKETIQDIVLTPQPVTHAYVEDMNITSAEPLIGRVKTQSRRSGSPYSMSPTWIHNAFQWSILGALGFTKAPRIPWKRG